RLLFFFSFKLIAYLSIKNGIIQKIGITIEWKLGGKGMTYRKLSLIVIIICILSVGLQATQSSKPVEAFSPQVIQQGAVGDDVIELQSRLEFVAIYNGKIAGVLGWGTYWALRNFEYEFGMKVDGIAGTATKEKLTKASKNYGGANKQQNASQGQKNTQTTAVNVPQGYSQNDIQLMANAVHGEA